MLNWLASVAAIVIIAGLTILALEACMSLITAVCWLSYHGWELLRRWLQR